MMPYGGRDLGQHWFRLWLVVWWHQVITWTNVDLSLRSCDVHLRAISLEMSQPSTSKISLKIIFLRFYWNLPGANELTLQVTVICGYRTRRWHHFACRCPSTWQYKATSRHSYKHKHVFISVNTTLSNFNQTFADRDQIVGGDLLSR